MNKYFMEKKIMQKTIMARINMDERIVDRMKRV
jgi:hypothetical protein